MRMVVKRSVIGLIMFVICCTGCGKKVELIPESISIILNHNGIHSAKIEKLINYNRYKLNYNSIYTEAIDISDSDVKKYIEIQMESYAQLIEISDREDVRNRDVVVVSYEVILDKKVVNRVEQDILMVGSGNYDQQFEEVLIGKYVRKPFTEELLSPNGEKMIFNITIESINYFKKYELTNDFVQEKMGLSSVEAYYEKCKEALAKEKIEEEKENAKRKLWENISQECEFLLDTEEIAQYSLQYAEMQKQMADIYGMNLDTYVQNILEKSKEDFFNDCYKMGEQEIKKYLLIGAIFSDLQYSITDKDIELMCEKFGYTFDMVSNDEYAVALVKYAIMEEKVIEYFEK